MLKLLAQLDTGMEFLKDAPVPIASLCAILFLVVYFLRHLREIASDHKEACNKHDESVSYLSTKFESAMERNTAALIEVKLQIAKDNRRD